MGDQLITFLIKLTNRGSDIPLQQVSFPFVSSAVRQSYPAVTNRAIMRQGRAPQVIILSSGTRADQAFPKGSRALKRKGLLYIYQYGVPNSIQLSSASSPRKEVCKGTERGQVCYTGRPACTRKTVPAIWGRGA